MFRRHRTTRILARAARRPQGAGAVSPRSKTGRYLSTFAGQGEPWKFNQCHKIAIDPRFQTVLGRLSGVPLTAEERVRCVTDIEELNTLSPLVNSSQHSRASL